MQQIIVIHGATAFNKYEDYLEYLKTKTLHPERFAFQPMWKERLQEELGEEYQILLPSMPNKTNARYSEWRLWFKNLESIITDNCILIGHSMGAVFLAKYLSEEDFSRTVKGTILVAAPHSDQETEDLVDFKLDHVSERFAQQAGKVTLYFGHNDPVIDSSEIERYKHDLPNALYYIVDAPDHFVRPTFPEVIDTIRSLQ